MPKQRKGKNTEQHMYTVDSCGKVTRIITPPQCGYLLWPYSTTRRVECQGAKGHEGDHWGYDQTGHLLTAPSPKDRKRLRIGFRLCPPGHKNYVSPEKMIARWYVLQSRTEPVTDPKLCERLRKGKLKSGETVNRPIAYVAAGATQTAVGLSVKRIKPRRWCGVGDTLAERIAFIVERCGPLSPPGLLRHLRSFGPAVAEKALATVWSLVPHPLNITADGRIIHVKPKLDYPHL